MPVAKRCYIVSFETAEQAVADSLHATIKEYGTWARITATTYAIVTDESAAEITVYLSNIMGESDRLFVVRAGSDAAWLEVRCNPEWLKKHLKNG